MKALESKQKLGLFEKIWKIKSVSEVSNTLLGG